MTTSVMETPLVFLVLVSALIGSTDGAWCVCRPEMSDSALQKTLDYACGAGADCGPISQNGACYNPNSVKAHCSYAANSYYQRKGEAPQACDFSGTATVTQQDPSINGCSFPASQSAAGSNNGASTGTGTGTGVNPVIGTGAGTSPGTGTGAGTGTGTGTSSGTGTGTGNGISTGATPTPTGFNPGSATPSTMTPTTSGNGVLGGLGPSGNGFSTDSSSSHSLFPMANMGTLLVLILSEFAIMISFG